MPELLFEIGVEELPSLAIEPSQAFMKEFLENACKEMRLSHQGIETYGTPRRLVAMVHDLAEKQEDLEEEILGPNSQIAYDAQGNLTAAGSGFLRSKGLPLEACYKKKTEKGEVLAAKKRTQGAKTKDIIAPLLIDMMRKIPFKKRMRWDASGDTFARPLRSLVCLFGSEYVSMSYANITSGEETAGHRFMNPTPFKVTSIAQYKSELAARHVVLNAHERGAMFLANAYEKLLSIGGKLVVDEDLMAIVRNLVEYPFVVLGSFEKKYLDIPSEILISEMKTHQKCFAVYDQHGALMPNFICSAATKPFDEDVFAKGNARVLRARFEDGAFYFVEDQKKKLSEHAQALKSLIFEKELGTVLDKSERILCAAVEVGRLLNLSTHDIDVIRKAAPLLKADLVTGVVGQFPELQGIMGRIYATKENIDSEVAECIETHYWPRFADDNLPCLKTAALLSIADKLDTLVGIVAIGKRPVGNKDPFALRRAAIGIVRMLVGFGMSIELETLIAVSLQSYGSRFSAKANEIIQEAKEFIAQRARGILIDDLGKDTKDYAVNFADSVMSVGSSDMLDIFARAHTLFAMHNQNKSEFLSLVQAFKRASNIVKKAESAGERINAEIKEEFLQAAQERALLQAVKEAKGLIGGFAQASDLAALQSTYVSIFSQIAKIKPKLDEFFDGVMVMVDEPNLRHARLALLSEIKRTADRIADFTHL